MMLLSSASAAFRLTTHQLLGGKRRFLTLVSFLLPVGLALLARTVIPSRTYDPAIGYALMLVGVYVGFFMPFMAIYWGSSVLTDEIEGKTLVYLWTRPAGRARLAVLKWAVGMFWLCLGLVLSLLLSYVVLSWSASGPPSIHNLQTVVWDGRALALGALAYGALAFLLAAVIKKPLTVGLVYVYFLDTAAAGFPGYFKLFSIRFYVLSLCTQREEGSQSEFARKLLELVEEITTTEFQSIATLVCTAAILLASGAFLVRGREFLGDDPARNQ